MSQFSPGTILLGFLAVIFGSLGAYVVKNKLAEIPEVVVEEEVEPAAPTSTVVPLASRELKAGRKITKTDVSIYLLTPEQIAERGLKSEFMTTAQDIIGQVVARDVKAGEGFDTSMFYPEGTGPSVADLLESGKRAMTVPVQMDNAVSGFASPGTWVDVYFTNPASEDPIHEEVTLLLLERVKILAVDEQTYEGARVAVNNRAGRTPNAAVTLAVSPEQAASLQVVNNRGTLSLALRNPDDEQLVSAAGPETLHQLLNVQPVPRQQMTIYRGNSSHTIEFVDDQRVSQSAPRYAAGHGTRPAVTTPVGAPAKDSQ